MARYSLGASPSRNTDPSYFLVRTYRLVIWTSESYLGAKLPLQNLKRERPVLNDLRKKKCVDGKGVLVHEEVATGIHSHVESLVESRTGKALVEHDDVAGSRLHLILETDRHPPDKKSPIVVSEILDVEERDVLRILQDVVDHSTSSLPGPGSGYRPPAFFEAG